MKIYAGMLKPIVICVGVLILFVSCSDMMSSSKFYSIQRNRWGSDDESLSVQTPQDVEMSEVEVPKEEDPFIVGDWNEPDYNGFSADTLKSWFFGASFGGANIPSYNFFPKDGRSWNSGNLSTAEATFDASGDGNKVTDPLIVGISPMTVYRYDGKNPLVGPDSSYNNSSRMKRFLFFRFTGKASIQSLNQYLIAVDTYSKLVFAYAKITATESSFGQLVPTGFGPVENYGEKRPFYEYDPIGIVHSTGEVELYDEYRNDMRSQGATKYFPQIHDPSRGIATYGKPGCSPYVSQNSLATPPENFIKSVKGNTYGIRNEYVLYTYKFNDDATELVIKAEDYYKGNIRSETVSLTEALNGHSAIYGNITIIAVESGGKVREEDSELIAIKDYSDPGVGFRLRVKGRTYHAADNSYKYVFDAEGQNLMYYKNGSLNHTYPFVEDHNNQTAVYQGGFAAYWGLRLSDYTDKNGQFIKDGELSWTLGSAPSAGSVSAYGHHKGYITKNTSSDFTKDVQNRSYGYRDGLWRVTYTFSNNGHTVTMNSEHWKDSAQSKRTVYTLEEHTMFKTPVEYKDESGSILKFYLKDSKDTLFLTKEGGDLVATHDFARSDPGPSFKDRVAGEVYIGSGYTYTFNEDGSSMYCKENGKTYTFATQDANNRAVYDDGSTGFFGLRFAFWGLRLADKDGVRDGVLYWAPGAGSSPGGTLTTGVSSTPAYKQR